MPTVAIEVVNERLSEHNRRAYAVPVRIGRGANCDIQLDPENRAISRLHVEIVEEGGEFVLYNRGLNQNATFAQGRFLKPNERIVVALGEVFKIFDFELKIISPAALFLLFTNRRDLRPRGEFPLPREGAIVAHGEQGRMTVETIASLKGFDASRLAGQLAVMFYYDGDEPTFAVLSNPDKLQVFLDRGFVQQDALYVQPLDTIEIGDHRFEVHPAGAPAIVCENPTCQVLNEYDRGENCRLCGTRLFGATRIVRGKP
jgi:hypothetical protein